MICNLNQNPKSSLEANRFLQLFLKAGVMWLLAQDHPESIEERAMTGSVSWFKLCQELCQYSALPSACFVKQYDKENI